RGEGADLDDNPYAERGRDRQVGAHSLVLLAPAKSLDQLDGDGGEREETAEDQQRSAVVEDEAGGGAEAVRGAGDDVVAAERPFSGRQSPDRPPGQQDGQADRGGQLASEASPRAG